MDRDDPQFTCGNRTEDGIDSIAHLKQGDM